MCNFTIILVITKYGDDLHSLIALHKEHLKALLACKAGQDGSQSTALAVNACRQSCKHDRGSGSGGILADLTHRHFLHANQMAHQLLQ